MTETFYDVLGVAEDATTDEIETAYRERLKETHPDVSDDDDAGRATKALIEARDVLVDDEERARYDRLGHDAYVSDGTPSASGGDAETNQADADSERATDRTGTDASGSETRNRARRERRARERVREARRRAREARQRRRQAAQGAGDAAASTADSGVASAGGRRAGPTDEASATNTYSVREDVGTPTSRGRLLPQGQELTLLGIFFALYPVLLFSALLPAFPLFVNLVLGACTLLTITYLQSMPRVALLLFGGWSALSLVGLAVFGVGYLSVVGLAVLAGTVLPFGFSVLTAAALRY
ncbi:J domain-containing protein [Haloarcula sediminis]|uniref:J domain-containing protein n=1 Tax=Haloarcula sediminis TaxID=3111777 RepID=UPI002D78ED1A|nr:DnaJ domain-containing protein [Haloarcula sp. CK38]